MRKVNIIYSILLVSMIAGFFIVFSQDAEPAVNKPTWAGAAQIDTTITKPFGDMFKIPCKCGKKDCFMYSTDENDTYKHEGFGRPGYLPEYGTRRKDSHVNTLIVGGKKITIKETANGK